MPAISMFYGIVIYMYNEIGTRHHKPHIHALYGEYEIVIELSGKKLEGDMPSAKLKLIEAWMEIHREDLLADWAILQSGSKPMKIDPLK